MKERKNSTAAVANYVIGLDFGTDSVRALLVDIHTKREIVAVENYPRWSQGYYCHASETQFRQHPADYMECMEKALLHVIAQCDTPHAIGAISIDSTASTPCLVNRNLTPLSLSPEYESDPDAMFILWKDHTAQAEADEITRLCATSPWNYARHSGNNYSAECFWAKVLHILRRNERLRRDAWIPLELCDWIPALLTGCRDVQHLRSSHCVAGAKLMWAPEWGGYPPSGFFATLEPALAQMAERMPQETYACGTSAGRLSPEWARRLGLSEDVVVGVGNIDSHSGAVGAGICDGTMVLNLGTSACYMAVMPTDRYDGHIIDGLFGQVENYILPDRIGFEAGLSAFGDVYAWFKRILTWPLHQLHTDNAANCTEYIEQQETEMLFRLGQAARQLPLREDAPLATDYLNGRRSPWPCSTLKSTLAGLTLATTAPELYYALVEATAFATRVIVDHLKTNGVTIERLIGIGGISQKSPFVMQTLADVLGMELSVADCMHACAQGAVIHASVAAGIYHSVEEAQQTLAARPSTVYRPDVSKSKILMRRYARYRELGGLPKVNLELQTDNNR